MVRTNWPRLSGRALLPVLVLGLGACGGGGGQGAAGAAAAGGGDPTGAGGTTGGGPGATGSGGSTATTGDLSQRPQPAGDVFDDTVLHQIELTMSADDWQSIIDDSRGDEWRHATITYDGVKVEDVGVHPSGEGSRFPGNAKMSVRVKFDAFPGRGKFGGLREINIKGEFDDGSMMRERLAFFVFRKVMPTPRLANARLMVNGGLRGLFTVRQVWDSQSLGEHFQAPIGPLYRLRPADPTSDPYKFISADPASYVPLPWQQDINNPARGDDVIPPALQLINDQPAQAEQAFDMDDLLSYLAAAALVQNIDGFVGDSGVEDHFQYFDPASGKFFILPWDPDNTFGSAGDMPTRTIYRRFSSSKLALAVRDFGDYRPRYKAKIAALMAALPLQDLQAEADRIFAQIQDAAHEDPLKIFPNSTFDWGVGYLKDFAAQRYANLQDQLANGP
jgi:spore coat protein H